MICSHLRIHQGNHRRARLSRKMEESDSALPTQLSQQTHAESCTIDKSSGGTSVSGGKLGLKLRRRGANTWPIMLSTLHRSSLQYQTCIIRPASTQNERIRDMHASYLRVAPLAGASLSHEWITDLHTAMFTLRRAGTDPAAATSRDRQVPMTECMICR